jgi:hypothetical protein
MQMKRGETRIASVDDDGDAAQLTLIDGWWLVKNDGQRLAPASPNSPTTNHQPHTSPPRFGALRIAFRSTINE